MRRECTCGAAGFGHEPGCTTRQDTDTDNHLELLLDNDREELTWPLP